MSEGSAKKLAIKFQVAVMKLLGTAVALACLSGQALGRAVSTKFGRFSVIEHPDLEQRALLQDIVSPCI